MKKWLACLLVMLIALFSLPMTLAEEEAEAFAEFELTLDTDEMPEAEEAEADEIKIDFDDVELDEIDEEAEEEEIIEEMVETEEADDDISEPEVTEPEATDSEIEIELGLSEEEEIGELEMGEQDPEVPLFTGKSDRYEMINGQWVCTGTEWIDQRASGDLQTMASLPKLPALTDVRWGQSGMMHVKIPSKTLGRINYEVYNAETDEWVTGVTYWGGSKHYGEFDDYWFIEDSAELPNGRYYFTVQQLGDNKKYSDSDIVKSDIYEYRKPDQALFSPVDVHWEKNGQKLCAAFSIPEESMEYGCGINIDYYYSSSRGEEPRIVGGTSGYWPGYSMDASFSWSVYDGVLEHGKGYYYFKARVLSRDIEAYRNSPWTEMSPAYKISDAAPGVEDILADAANLDDPEDIRNAVQDLDPLALRAAMLSDSEIIDQLAKLEDMVGGPATVSSSRSEFPAGDVSIVGANLNTPVGGDITLNIGDAAKEDVLPSTCSNTLAVRFSMGLDHVANDDELEVPVLITLPVPQSINPEFLVILHYNMVTGKPETIFPMLKNEGGVWYASFAVTHFSDFVVTERAHDVGKTDYLIVKTDESVRISSPKGEAEVIWSLENEPDYGWDYAEISEPVTEGDMEYVDVEGLSEGTVWVTAQRLEGGKWITDRTRVDIVYAYGGSVGSDELEGVYLQDSTATVELFSTEYTQIHIDPALYQNMSLYSVSLIDADTLEKPEDNGKTVSAAVFEDNKTAAVFDLVVKDDRTLLIVPKTAAVEEAAVNPKAVAATYTSAIRVTIDGKDYSTSKLKITVKQKPVAIKATKLALDSTLETPKALQFTGGEVIAVEPDMSKSVPLPAWITLDPDNMTLSASGNVSKSGKVYLLCTVKGSAAKTPVTVSVTAKPAAPKVTFSAKSLTLNPNIDDLALVTVKVGPDSVLSQSLEGKEIVEVIGKRKVPVEENVLDAVCTEYADQDVPPADGVYHIAMSVGDDYDGLPHTYQFVFSFCGKDFPLTVKVLGENVMPVVTAKGSGSIDLSVPKSEWKASFTYKNTNSLQLSREVRVFCRENKDAEPVDVTSLFAAGASDTKKLTLYAVDPDALDPTCLYEVEIVQKYGKDVESVTRIAIPVKRSPATKVRPTASLKATGSIDVLRPDTAAVLKPAFKNVFDYTLTEDDLVFYTVSGKKLVPMEEDAFEVDVENGSYVIRVKEQGMLSHTIKYKVAARIVCGGVTVETAPVAISVVKGKAKINVTPRTVSLIGGDRYDQTTLNVSINDPTLTGVDCVTLGGANASLFSLERLDDDTYAIGYSSDASFYSAVAGKSKKVTVNVWLNGNYSQKPDAAVALTIKFKK